MPSLQPPVIKDALLLDVDKIRFSQNSVGSNFKDGRSVEQLTNEMKTGKKQVWDIPPIRVYETHKGNYVTHDNRRLKVVKDAHVKQVPVLVTEGRVPEFKFTTADRGQTVAVVPSRSAGKGGTTAPTTQGKGPSKTTGAGKGSGEEKVVGKGKSSDEAKGAGKAKGSAEAKGAGKEKGPAKAKGTGKGKDVGKPKDSGNARSKDCGKGKGCEKQVEKGSGKGTANNNGKNNTKGNGKATTCSAKGKGKGKTAVKNGGKSK